MLWLFFFSSLSFAKYFYPCSMHTTTVAMWAPAPCFIDSTHAHVVLGRTDKGKSMGRKNAATALDSFEKACNIMGGRRNSNPIPSLFRVWGLPRTTRTSYRGTVLNQCKMALAPTWPQLWCAYCIGGNIWQKTMKKKETPTAS